MLLKWNLLLKWMRTIKDVETTKLCNVWEAFLGDEKMCNTATELK